MTHPPLSEREKNYYDVQIEDGELARQFWFSYKEDLYIGSTRERGFFFRRLPHKNFKPLKHIKFHRFITDCSSFSEGLNGILFSNDTENFRSKLKLTDRQHFQDSGIVRAKDSYANIQSETLASDDMEPYQITG